MIKTDEYEVLKKINLKIRKLSESYHRFAKKEVKEDAKLT